MMNHLIGILIQAKDFLCKITGSKRQGGRSYKIFSTYHSERRDTSSYIPPTLIRTTGTYQPKRKNVIIISKYELWVNSYHLESRVGVETIELNFFGAI